MKQTAVEFLLENIEILIKQGNTFNYPIFKYYFIEEAKEMEKQQQKGYSEEDVKNAFLDGWQLRDEDLPFPKAKKKWFNEFKKE